MIPDDIPAGGFTSDYLTFWLVWGAFVVAAWLFFRGKRGKPGALRLVAGNAVVLVVLLWTIVVAAETYLRYVYDGTDTYSLMLTHQSWWKRHVRFNSSGLFRDREWAREKPAGVERVGCFGDSFTMGWGVADPADAWPQRVHAALAVRAPGRFDVRNYAIAGYSTSLDLNMMHKVLPVDALDRVVLGYCLNDADDLLPPERWLFTSGMPKIPWIRPTWSFVADFFWYRFKLSSDPRVRGFFDEQREAYEDPGIWSRQCAQFREMAELCRASSVRLDVVVFPFFTQWGDGYPYDGCHDRAAEAWRALGVEVVDLRDAYRGIPSSELVVNRFDSHPNERALEIASRVILERLFAAR